MGIQFPMFCIRKEARFGKHTLCSQDDLESKIRKQGRMLGTCQACKEAPSRRLCNILPTGYTGISQIPAHFTRIKKVDGACAPEGRQNHGWETHHVNEEHNQQVSLQIPGTELVFRVFLFHSLVHIVPPSVWLAGVQFLLQLQCANRSKFG